MASHEKKPKCPECKESSFEAVKAIVKNADNLMVFIVCSNCEYVVSVVPFSAAWDE